MDFISECVDGNDIRILFPLESQGIFYAVFDIMKQKGRIALLVKRIYARSASCRIKIQSSLKVIEANIA